MPASEKELHSTEMHTGIVLVALQPVRQDTIH
jgi:hypothetical protein